MKNESKKQKRKSSRKSSSKSANSSKSRSRSRSKSISKKSIEKIEDKNEFREDINKIKSSIFSSKTNIEPNKTNISDSPIYPSNTVKTSSIPDNILKQSIQYHPQLISSEKELTEIKTQIHYDQEEAPISYEGFINKGIINDFKDIPYYLDELNIFSLFEKKDMAEQNLESTEYNIENLLLMDQTNKKLQKKYISIAIKLLNSEKDKKKIDILNEKIKKAGIILDENIYTNEIKNILNDTSRQKLAYINYKQSFFDTLNYIVKEENSTLIEAKNKLKIEKIYQFNQPAELGNNNYYFYKICLQLRIKMEEIFGRFNLYTKLINRIIEFTKGKNFDNLTKNEKFLFNYQLEILLDKETISNKEELNKVLLFLDGEKANEEEILKAVQSSKTNNNLNYNKIKTMEYELNYDKKSKELKFLIKEQRKLFRKKYYFNKTYSYKIDNFNKKIIQIIKKDFDHNFEAKLLENPLPNEDNINELYKEIRPEFNRIIKKILSSKAAENFFVNHYKEKDKYKELVYHFNNDKVQNKIIEGIIFAPIYNNRDKAITNPIDLTIIINSIPWKSPSDFVPIFNRKILMIANYILFGIHEILGHYLRRYYSYFTGQRINFNTEGDNDVKTGIESGWYVESHFLGIVHDRILRISEALSLFYWEKFDTYPIIPKNSKFEVDENKLKIIVESNKNIFDFVKLSDTDKDEQKITIKEYLDLVSYSSRPNYSRIHCPQSNEDYIYWY